MYAHVSDFPLQRVQRGNRRSHLRFEEAHSVHERRWEWGLVIFDILVELIAGFEYGMIGRF